MKEPSLKLAVNKLNGLWNRSLMTRSLLSFVHWDIQTYAPPRSIPYHQRWVLQLQMEDYFLWKQKEWWKAMQVLKENQEKLDLDEKALLRRVERRLRRVRLIPFNLYQHSIVLSERLTELWLKRRKEASFKEFVSLFGRLIKTKQEISEILGYEEDPYEPHWELYEPDIPLARLQDLFRDLEKVLDEIRPSLKLSPGEKGPSAVKHREQLLRCGREILKRMGFDFSAGRVDVSAHPFAMFIAPTDVRMTIRFEGSIFDTLSALLHEGGHSLYDQNVKSKEYGKTLRGQPAGLTIHESQSRFWENGCGKEFSFWKFVFRQKWGLKEIINWRKFKKALRELKLSPIRVQSDEFHYHYHILLRYRIERKLLSGELKVKDLPEYWNEWMITKLGLKIENDWEGVLQDIHWYQGTLGYFPTYSLGSLLSYSLWNRFREECPGWQEILEKGQWIEITQWLRKKIHRFGDVYPTEALIQKAIRGFLNTEDFRQTILRRYSDGPIIH